MLKYLDVYYDLVMKFENRIFKVSILCVGAKLCYCQEPSNVLMT